MRRKPGDQASSVPGSEGDKPESAAGSGERPAPAEDEPSGGLRGKLQQARNWVGNKAPGFGGSLQAGRDAAKAEAAAEAAEAAALQAQRAVWKAVHEALEDIAFELWFVPLFSAIPVLVLTLRLILGNLLGKFFIITFRGTRLALVPSMEMSELVMRLGKNVLLLVLTLLWVVIIVIIYKVISMNKLELVTKIILLKIQEFLHGT